jgi:hypothetical protein
MIDKLWSGVLRVQTPLGPRYFRPSLLQRVYLLWIFRNFPTLPVKVLRPAQLRFVERLLNQHGFVLQISGFDDMPVLGTLEQRPPAEIKPTKGSAADRRSPFATDESGS